MSRHRTSRVIALYDSYQAFNAQLDAAFESVQDDHEHAQLLAIENRYEDMGDFAELSADEYDLITRLADKRTAIGPTDV